MEKSKLGMIDQWERLLSLRFPMSPLSISSDAFGHLIPLIESSYEGNILCDIDHPADIAMICLLIKHLSRQYRRVILPNKHRAMVDSLAAIGIDHMIIVTDEWLSYAYIFTLSKTPIDLQDRLHPLGGSVINSTFHPHAPVSCEIQSIFSLPSLKAPQMGPSPLAKNDILFLNQLFSSLPAKKNYHLLILTMNASQQVIQLIELFQFSHPTNHIHASIVAPFFSSELFAIELPNATLSFIKSPWSENEKSYPITPPPDVVIIDSINFDLITAPNFVHLVSMIQSACVVCFFHFYGHETLTNYSDFFAIAYRHQFVKDLAKISKFITDLDNHHPRILPKLPYHEVALPNTHALVPGKTTCWAFSISPSNC